MPQQSAGNRSERQLHKSGGSAVLAGSLAALWADGRRQVFQRGFWPALPLKGTLGIKIADKYFFIDARLMPDGRDFFVVLNGRVVD